MAKLSFQLKRKISTFAGAMACLLALTMLAQAETILRDTPLQADRFVDAPVVVLLPRGTDVVVLKMEAGWTQIRVNVQTGWVRASVIDGAGAAKAKVAQMESGRLARNNILATSGTRSPIEVISDEKKAAAAEQNSLQAMRKQADKLRAQKAWPDLEVLLQAITASPYALYHDYRNLADALEQQGKFASATALHLAILQMEPNNPHVQNSVCWHWLLQNQALNARPYCQKSVELNGNNYSALLNMGHTYLLLNDEAQAKKWYQETLLKLKSEAELNDGPVDDFKLFIKNGWQVQLATAYQQWFVQGWATQQTSKASVSK